METKMCSMCYQVKALDDFRDSSKYVKCKDGTVERKVFKDCYCRDCRRIYGREHKRAWREINGRN